MRDDYVLDASALIEVLIGTSEAADAIRVRLHSMRRHAPHVIDAEVGNVLRRHVLSGLISADTAREALVAGAALVDHRYAQTGALAELAWTLRANVTFCDALYAALAMQLGVPLVTADVRLAKTLAPTCSVEVV